MSQKIQILKYLKEPFKPSLSEEKIKKFKIASLKRLIPYAKSHWKNGLTGSIFMIIISLLALPSPYLMKLIIDEVLSTKNIKILNLIVIILIGIQLLRLVFSFLTNYLFDIFSQDIIVRVKKDLFYRLLRLPLSFFDKNQTGYILSRVNEVEGLNLFFSSNLIRVLIGLFEFAFCLIIIFCLNWKLTLISLLILPLFYFATKFYSRSIRKFSRKVMEKGAILSRHIQDSLSGVDVIKFFAAEKRETEKIHGHLDELKFANIKTNIILTFSSELLSLLGALGGFLVLWYSSLDIIKGNFTIGSYIAFSAYLAKLFGPTQILSNIGLMFQPAITALERITELMELAGEEESDKGKKLKKIGGEIEFKKVSFSYDTKKVLTDINFKINKGEKIILAGPNGSGKSTIVKLILGLYKVQAGTIIIDNYDINEISLTSLRERISIVSQNTFLFNDTIKNNILYSRPEAKAEQIEEAAKLSGAYEFIQRLANGFETEIGERGVRLSGGENQKIAITRAILKDSDMIIFDEATTHLDQESEIRINRLIKEEFKNKTCIIISHKIRNLPQIDKLYFIKEGKVIEVTEDLVE